MKRLYGITALCIQCMRSLSENERPMHLITHLSHSPNVNSKLVLDITTLQLFNKFRNIFVIISAGPIHQSNSEALVNQKVRSNAE